MPAIELEVNDTTSNENSDTPPIARAWSEHYEILHEENNPICGTFMNISVLGLLIVGLQFACRLVHVCHSGKVKIKAFINFILCKYSNQKQQQKVNCGMKVSYTST